MRGPWADYTGVTSALSEMSSFGLSCCSAPCSSNWWRLHLQCQHTLEETFRKRWRSRLSVAFPLVVKVEFTSVEVEARGSCWDEISSSPARYRNRFSSLHTTSPPDGFGAVLGFFLAIGQREIIILEQLVDS